MFVGKFLKMTINWIILRYIVLYRHGWLQIEIETKPTRKPRQETETASVIIGRYSNLVALFKCISFVEMKFKKENSPRMLCTFILCDTYAFESSFRAVISIVHNFFVYGTICHMVCIKMSIWNLLNCSPFRYLAMTTLGWNLVIWWWKWWKMQLSLEWNSALKTTSKFAMRKWPCNRLVERGQRSPSLYLIVRSPDLTVCEFSCGDIHIERVFYCFDVGGVFNNPVFLVF